MNVYVFICHFIIIFFNNKFSVCGFQAFLLPAEGKLLK